MASYLTHMRVAEEVLKNFPNIDYRDFLVGNLSPDSGIVENGKYNPPSDVTHFKDQRRVIEYQRFIEKYLNDISSNNNCAFLLGYLSHLMTDYYFALEWKKTYENIHGPWSDMKKDIKDLIHNERFHWDFVYLETGTFELYKVFNSMETFDYTMPFFDEKLIENKMRSIQRFYKENGTMEDVSEGILSLEWNERFICEVGKIISVQLEKLLSS